MKQKICLIIGLLALVLTSCNNDDELLKYIPEDASWVVKVDVPNLIQKSGVTLEGEKVMFEGKEIPQPQKTTIKGIDYKYKAFLYGVGKNPYVVVKLDDQTAFEKSIMEMDDVEQLDLNGVSCYKIERNKFIAVKDGIAIFADSTDDLQSKFALEKNINANDDAMKNLSKDGDIVAYLQYSKLSEIASSSKSTVAAGIAGGIYNNGSVIVNFLDGKVEIKSDNLLNKENQFAKMLEDGLGKIETTDFLKFMPSDAMGIFAINLNGKKLIENEGFNALVTTVGMGFGLDDAKKEAIKSINGPIVIGCAENWTNYYVAVKTSNPQSLQSMAQGLPLAQQDGYLVFKTQDFTQDATSLNIDNLFKGNIIGGKGVINDKGKSYDIICTAKDLTKFEIEVTVPANENALKYIIRMSVPNE